MPMCIMPQAKEPFGLQAVMIEKTKHLVYIYKSAYNLVRGLFYGTEHDAEPTK